MSDYTPDPNRYDANKGYDRYGNARFEPVDGTGRGPYVLLALLAIIGLVGGLMFFNASPKDPSANTATAPASTRQIERTTPRQLPPVAPQAPADQATPPAQEK